MVELDNLHYDFREIDGYNKAFNFIMSPRELGKTSMMWYKKIYLNWKKDKRPWIYLVRTCVEITDALIDSIQESIINKFSDDNVTLKYKSGSFKDGIVDVFINGEIFFRVVALSIKLRRIKLAVLKNIKGVLMDEYIIDTRSQEKYIPNEAFKIKEAYTTWSRECEGVLKFYILGNPYSLYNPLFMDWNVDVNSLKKGKFYIGNAYVIHWPILSEELKAKLLAKNPLYQFDEQYSQYAKEGSAINDNNIRLGVLPQNYELKFVIKLADKILGIFKNKMYNINEDRYFVRVLDNVSKYRTIYCFDFESMINHSQIMNVDDRLSLATFMNALRTRQVLFEDINAYYLTMEVYKNV